MNFVKHITVLIIFLFVGCVHSFSQVSYTKADSLIFEKYITAFVSKKDMPISELILQTAMYFKGTPYVSATLEKNKKAERLTINLRELDCTTLVENCIALSMCVQSDAPSFSTYCKMLQDVRYRKGIIDGYNSRLHYASDWMYENEKRGIFANISYQLGGEKFDKEINFMSSYSKLYPQLADNKKLIDDIKIIESLLNKRSGYYVINKENLRNINKEILDGDIILFSTVIKGLDFSHMAVAYHSNGCLSFVHASSSEKKVVVDKQSLYQYCKNSGKCDGVVILRLLK